MIDAYTHYVLQYLEDINKTSSESLQDLASLRRVLCQTGKD